MTGTEPSTDFEVHRNWKAITNTLQIEKWYFEETSEWTLDYPPMFAYMEFILGLISKFFDEKITKVIYYNFTKFYLKLDNLYYKDFSCILFQRLTVLIGDFLLLLSVKKLASSMNLIKKDMIYLLIFIQGFAGLILVDNIHFQYNTILLSIFLYSLSLIFEDNFIKGAIVYSILINMKHIFIYMAPAYFVYYLKYYIIKEKFISQNLKNLLKVAASIIAVFLISFSPFIYLSIRDGNLDQFTQIFKRLFPFKRGLLHAYWAPNFWAIYSFFDKLILTIFSKEGNKFNMSSQGLNQDIQFDMLPNITTKLANLVIISISFIFIIKTLIFDKYETEIKIKRSLFLKYLIQSCLIFFNFGFQVHEKAFIKISILAIILYFNENLEKPLNSNTFFVNSNLNEFYLLLMILVGIFAQMPLIHNYKDYLIKLIVVLVFILYTKLFLVFTDKKYSQLNLFINSCIIFILVLDLIIVINPLINLKSYISDIENTPQQEGNKYIIIFSNLKEKYQFLPLMIFSVINSIIVQIIIVITIIFKLN